VASQQVHWKTKEPGSVLRGSATRALTLGTRRANREISTPLPSELRSPTLLCVSSCLHGCPCGFTAIQPGSAVHAGYHPAAFSVKSAVLCLTASTSRRGSGGSVQRAARRPAMPIVGGHSGQGRSRALSAADPRIRQPAHSRPPDPQGMCARCRGRADVRNGGPANVPVGSRTRPAVEGRSTIGISIDRKAFRRSTTQVTEN
jgi:hypothetical protein